MWIFTMFNHACHYFIDNLETNQTSRNKMNIYYWIGFKSDLLVWIVWSKCVIYTTCTFTDHNITMFVKERETQALWHCDWSMSPMSSNSMSPKCYPLYDIDVCNINNQNMIKINTHKIRVTKYPWDFVNLCEEMYFVKLVMN